MTIEPQCLTGLDAANPLGFLAAVGLLRWCAEVGGHPSARLAFVHDGTYRPVLHGTPPVEDLCAELAADAPRWLDQATLGLSYAKKDGTVRDLKPPPEVWATWLRERRSEGDTTALAFALGFGSELATDNTGQVKPTALHFTAGKQQFLSSVREIAESVTPDDFREALIGPWRYHRTVKSLSWDASTSRDWALRASDPSREKRAGIPGADWLAFHALPLLPVVGVHGRACTACVGGRWKSGWFRWPVWEPPCGIGGVRSLLLDRSLQRLRPVELAARGIFVVLASDIRRSDQGGYGAFGPARAATSSDGVGG